MLPPRFGDGPWRGRLQAGPGIRANLDRFDGWLAELARLGGACEACARCCERPSIRAGRATSWLPLLRRAFLAWQARVNGFDLVEHDRDARVFHFRCTHFDWTTRRCDSYASRPHMCRDYPRGLLDQPWPELFEGCGHRVLLRRADGLSQAIEATNLDEAARRELRRRMRLE